MYIIYMVIAVSLYVCGSCLCTSTIMLQSWNHLHSFNVAPAHAAAAVNEEYEFAVDLPQVRADRFEVRAEVDHDHRVVEDVFMESSVNDIYLKRKQEK